MKTRILENKTAAKWIGVILIVFFCAIGIKSCYKSPAVYYPIAADAQDIWVHTGETAKVKIRLDCWSGCINTPPNRWVVIDFPGEHEYLFVATGKHIQEEDKSTNLLGKVPDCSFRIKGTAGEATITVQ